MKSAENGRVVERYEYGGHGSRHKPDYCPTRAARKSVEEKSHQLGDTEKSDYKSRGEYEQHEEIMPESRFQIRNGVQNGIIIAGYEQEHASAYSGNHQRATCQHGYSEEREITAYRHIFRKVRGGRAHAEFQNAYPYEHDKRYCRRKRVALFETRFHAVFKEFRKRAEHKPRKQHNGGERRVFEREFQGEIHCGERGQRSEENGQKKHEFLFEIGCKIAQRLDELVIDVQKHGDRAAAHAGDNHRHADCGAAYEIFQKFLESHR